MGIRLSLESCYNGNLSSFNIKYFIANKQNKAILFGGGFNYFDMLNHYHYSLTMPIIISKRAFGVS